MMGSVLSLLSCSRATMPESELESVEFTRSGTMAGYEYEGRVKKDSSGVFVLRAMKETYGPLFEKQLTAEQVTRFREIIVEEKMYKYKERYTPMMEVLDDQGELMGEDEYEYEISSNGKNPRIQQKNWLHELRDDKRNKTAQKGDLRP